MVIQEIVMLLGEFRHTLDPKSRLAVPAKFRSELHGSVVITRGIDHCLFLYGMKEWEKLVEKLMMLPLTQSNSRAFSRLMLSGASDTELDGQGRILIPEYLRAYANLEKEVVLVGVHSRVEVWRLEAWDAYRTKTENASEEITENLSQLGML